MSYTHTVRPSIDLGGGDSPVIPSQSYSSSSRVSFTETVANSSTDYEIALTLDVTAVVSFFLMSDKNVTLETNSGSAADNTIALVANVPYIWNTGSYDAFLLDTDVTSVFITNASGASAIVQCEAVFDSTPS